MLARLGRHLTYTNVIATLAVFLALGGVSWAAIRVPRNSVGTKQLKAKAVTLSKIHPEARALFDGPKGDKGLEGLRGPVGPVPPSEPLHVVGEAGEPPFEKGNGGGAGGDDCPWSNFDGSHSLAAFFKDPSGVVHVKGLVKAADKVPGSPNTNERCDFSPTATSDNWIFRLPEGYRPARRAVFTSLGGNTTALMRVDVRGDGVVEIGFAPNPEKAKEWVSLEGLSFRAEQ